MTVCDEALAAYLVHVSKRVRVSFYLRTLKFVLMYRDCFTKLYSSLTKSCPDAQPVTLSQSAKSKKLTQVSSDLCSRVSSTLLPEISNEFILNYCRLLSGKAWLPARSDLIDLTKHLCDWLLKKGFTDRQLLANNDSNQA